MERIYTLALLYLQMIVVYLKNKWPMQLHNFIGAKFVSKR
jgi:hypothetical protein